MSDIEYSMSKMAMFACIAAAGTVSSNNAAKSSVLSFQLPSAVVSLLSNDVNIAFFIFVVSDMGAICGRCIGMELQSF
jgi:hypothetical protein